VLLLLLLLSSLSSSLLLFSLSDSLIVKWRYLSVSLALVLVLVSWLFDVTLLLVRRYFVVSSALVCR